MGALQKRVLAALVLIPLVAAAVLWLPTPGFALVLALFAVAGALEWRQVGNLPAALHVPFLALTSASLLAALLLVHSQAVLWSVLGLALAAWWVALLGVVRYQHGSSVPGVAHPAGRALAGWLLIVPCFLSLVWLHDQRPALVMYVLVLIWVADSGAFFAGRRFGRRRLASRVSPGKSWEGVAGGLAGVALLALGVALSDPGSWHGVVPLLTLSLAVALASVLGDLVESLFKRQAGIKDSGTLIPGHGGVLDRIDSLTAAGPFFAAGWLAMGIMP